LFIVCFIFKLTYVIFIYALSVQARFKSISWNGRSAYFHLYSVCFTRFQVSWNCRSDMKSTCRI